MLEYRWHRASGIGHRASGIGHRASGIGHRASGIGHFLFVNGLKCIHSFFDLYVSLFSLLSRTSFLDLICQYNKKFLFIKKIATGVIFLLIVTEAECLSRATSNAIQGTAPQFVGLDKANKLGFKVNGVFYSQDNGLIDSNTSKLFDVDLTLNDFLISNLSVNDLDLDKDFKDLDGDNPHLTEPFEISKHQYSWIDNNDNLITGDKLKVHLGCDNKSYEFPIKLVISATVKVKSQYGIPQSSEEVTLTKSYMIAPKGDICYVKPNSTIVYPKYQWRGGDASGKLYEYGTGPIQRDPSNGGGYTADFIVDKGFRARPIFSNKTFPTTGFPGAQFQLIMNYSQDSYYYSVVNNPGNVVTIDQNGNVLLNAKPPNGSGDIVVRATLKTDTNQFFDYKFNPTTVWLEPQAVGAYDWNTAFSRFCGGINGFPSRKDYTNSPIVNAGPNWQRNGKFNFGTRAINDGLYPEWGYITRVTYPNSKWEAYDTWYWTGDYDDDEHYFMSYLHDGGVLPGPRIPIDDVNGNDTAFIVCKK